ncbi:hypothetical protein BLNAU_15820 [Blattamonas nauphoetae]|uniref:Uncharacterized protein n=1 Tax=Blattamonas nauphoetae TaxID=2049346 RepID=A0ABQ9XD51_9EUKA|nr:hypothetical protein BLNAU_15820 [Blattamonas nauphoetae]
MKKGAHQSVNTEQAGSIEAVCIKGLHLYKRTAPSAPSIRDLRDKSLKIDHLEPSLSTFERYFGDCSAHQNWAKTSSQWTTIEEFPVVLFDWVHLADSRPDFLFVLRVIVE